MQCALILLFALACIYQINSLQVLTAHNVKDQQAIQKFFQSLVEMCMDSQQPTARLDFLACSALRSSDIESLAAALKTITKVICKASSMAMLCKAFTFHF